MAKWRSAWLVAIGVVAGFVLAGLAGQEPPEINSYLHLDITKLDPKRFTVEFENDQVRAIRARLGPDASAPLHDARSGVVVAVTETHVRFIRIDKRMQYIDLDPGQVQWAYGDTHSVKNATNKAAEFLFIELKDKQRTR